MDKLKSRIEDLEAHNRGLEVEIRKMKEALILLDAKIHKKPRNYFDYSTDDDDEEHFYLDHINGI